MDSRTLINVILFALWPTVWGTACGDDSVTPTSSDAAADGAHDATLMDARRETGPIGDSGGMIGDGGLPAPPTGCYSAADCTDAGPGALCCYSMTMMAIACVPEGGQCDYRQCQVCDNECPVGLSCVGSPFGGRIRYCAAGDGGAGSDGSGACGAGDAGLDAGDSGNALDSGGDVESGSSEAAVDAPADTAEGAADAVADTAADATYGDANE
jgi:hypothetical protein